MSEPLHVLVVEDSPTDARLMVHELEREHRTLESQRVEDPAAMRAALEQHHWDVIIADWTMPKFSATAALAMVQQMKLDIPFIIVSGTVGEDLAADAMRAGAHDYVLKDNMARLGPAVDREVRDANARGASRRADAQLQLSETRFARLSESGIIGIVVADVVGNVHEANDAYLTMIGYSRDEVLSGAARWADMTPPEWRATDDAAIAELQAHGVARAWEKELIRKDGTRVPVLIGVAMLEYPTCICFIADLTERKRAEGALRRSEGFLRQSQKMEAIGSLAGGIAHDFNNLLTVILSYCSLLIADLKPADPMRADLDEVQAAARRAAGLTRQLLVFSRQQSLQPVLIDLRESALQVERMLKRMIGENIELTTVGAPALGKIMADPSQIEQIIMNLAVNARDAMPEGGSLVIETADVVLDEAYATEHAGVTPGRHVMLAMTDTGTGMDEALQARIFEPFFTTKEKGQGTGLGLAIVFGIVEQSGGSIAVDSEPGRGTTFRIYFPRAIGAVESPCETMHPDEIAPQAAETILLVEDDEQVRNVAGLILRRSGYRVLEAQNGGDALLICEQQPTAIHLLLTDVVMPRMSGPQLAARVKCIRPEMRVLYMSGYAGNSITEHTDQDPAIPLLQKPLTLESLTRTVRQVLAEPAPAPAPLSAADVKTARSA
jgi:two-component system, cell cycle sensor histidine kinase and response regulator CckA